jgi:hypothetical protein
MMKKKTCSSDNHYLQEALSTRCWAQDSRNRHKSRKRLYQRYQKKIDSALATMAIGLMFLAGIWTFLIQLAEFGFSS